MGEFDRTESCRTVLTVQQVEGLILRDAVDVHGWRDCASCVILIPIAPIVPAHDR